MTQFFFLSDLSYVLTVIFHGFIKKHIFFFHCLINFKNTKPKYKKYINIFK